MLNNNDYVLITDSTCDLPINIIKDNNVKLLDITYEIDGTVYYDSTGLSFQEFYKEMRAGKRSNTSQISPAIYEKVFEEILQTGKDFIYISFSSGLSGSFNNARRIAEELQEKYPDRKIKVVDSRCASLGEGLLVYKAINLKKDGMDIDALADWVEKNRDHLVHMFTVDDLMFLHRGGRVSKTSAIAGSILGIKPGLHVDLEGHLIPITKIRGRKQSIQWLVDEMDKRKGNWENDTFAICHGDCIEDAKYLESLVKEKYGIKNSIIRETGPVIGAHSGPGTLALFFMGDEK